MRTASAVAALVFAASIAHGPLRACGDKFFQVGSGASFGAVYASLHPGRIVIYTSGSTQTGKGLGDERLRKHFVKAGHRVTVAADAEALGRELQSGTVDIVLLDAAAVAEVMPRTEAAASRPSLLRVQSKSAAKAAGGKSSSAELKESDKIHGFLDKIEDTMKARGRTQP